MPACGLTSPYQYTRHQPYVSIRVEPVEAANHAEYQHFVRNCAQAVVQQTSEWSEVIAAVGQDRPSHLLARDDSGAVVGDVFRKALIGL